MESVWLLYWRAQPRRSRAAIVALLSTPGPVHPDIRIIFRLAGNGMAVAEQELFVRIALEMVVAAEVDHRGRLILRWGRTFASVRKHLAAEFKPVAREGVLQQESPIWEIVEVSLRHNRFSGAAIQKPGAEIFLQPDGQFVPAFAHAKALVGVTGSQFEHGERADLRDVFALFDVGDLRA